MRTTVKSCLVAAGLVTALAGFTLTGIAPSGAAQGAAQLQAPQFRYDPSFPKPLPNDWIIQSVRGLAVDREDNVWVLNNPGTIIDAESYAEENPPAGECCRRAPAVIKFSPAGDVLAAWGGAGHVPGWPQGEHTLFLDSAGNVWIAGATAGDTLMQFSPDGKLLRDFGKRPPAQAPAAAQQAAGGGRGAGAQQAAGGGRGNQQQMNNQQTEFLLRGVADAALDEPAREIYIADGYLNKRVIVYDLDTGAFKRGWGAYGTPLAQISNNPVPPLDRNPSAPPLREFRPAVHCVEISNDGLVYVCDSDGARVQVFTKRGEFQKEFLIADRVKGSTRGIAFSPDREQRFLYVADIQNAAIWILERQTGKVLSRFGRRSYNGGDFTLMHLAVSDSRGNIYAGEVGDAGRIQRFVPVP
jgi:DNA-binding beta-propeller fold protein YncE